MKYSKAIFFAFFLTFIFGLIGLAQETGKPVEQPPKQSQQNPQQKSQEPEDQGPIEIPKTTDVVVPVIVTDPFGRFIGGLKKSDFSLREDDKPQEISAFSDASAPFSVALLIDVSRSTRNKLDDIKRTAIEFTKLLQPRDKVLIVAFDEKVRFISDFTGDQKELEKSIKSLKTSYLTSLYDAIDQTVREKLMNAKGRRAIVVMSDGVDTGSRKASYNSVLDLIAQTGVIAYSVRYETRNDGPRGMIKPSDLPYLGPRPFEKLFQFQSGTIQKQKPKDRDLIGIEFLRDLAARSGALYIRSESIEMTAAALYKIADEIRNQYTLVYNPTNDAADGTFRQITVKLNRGEFLIRSRQGYVAPKVQPSKEPRKSD